jgi:hypothetical protein
MAAFVAVKGSALCKREPLQDKGCSRYTEQLQWVTITSVESIDLVATAVQSTVRYPKYVQGCISPS